MSRYVVAVFQYRAGQTVEGFLVGITHLYYSPSMLVVLVGIQRTANALVVAKRCAVKLRYYILRYTFQLYYHSMPYFVDHCVLTHSLHSRSCSCKNGPPFAIGLVIVDDAQVPRIQKRRSHPCLYGPELSANWSKDHILTQQSRYHLDLSINADWWG